MNSPPKIEDAPGLKWRRRRTGYSARWQCRDDLAERGCPLKQQNLYFWKGEEMKPAAAALIGQRCRQLQAEMLVWGRGGVPKATAYDGSIQGLADCYMSDSLSDYFECEWATRKHYQSLCKVIMRTPWTSEDRITQTVGLTQISEVRARVIKMWHRSWSHDLTKIPMGHACTTMLRTLVGFGVSILEDEECVRLSTILSHLSFPTGQARTSTLSTEQVIAVRKLAHKRGHPSIALAQAIQFEFTWRQKDVIGEWVPISERGSSEILDGNDKWRKGIRWNEIDERMLVNHITSKRKKLSEPSIMNAPMVLEELQRIYGTTDRAKLPASGPVIICEETELPWRAHKFRLVWRGLATECSIPANVKNMDTRAGAITEAFAADAPGEKVRKTATHSNISMTHKYSRDDAQATADVMQIRAKSRVNKQ